MSSTTAPRGPPSTRRAVMLARWPVRGYTALRRVPLGGGEISDEQKQCLQLLIEEDDARATGNFLATT